MPDCRISEANRMIEPDWRARMRCRLPTCGRYVFAAAALVLCWQPQPIEASALEDDGLVVMNGGPSILLPGTPRGSRAGNVLRFETDECGLLRGVQSRHSMFNASAFEDDQDDTDEFDDDVGEAPDPAWARLQDWLYDHPDIGVLSQGIDKWCSDDESIVGIDLGTEFDATWDHRRSPFVQARVAKRFNMKLDIA
jgi:hypothetical protein